MLQKLCPRLKAAWQVLRGVRPAETQFDRSDDQIAQSIAEVTADRVFFELAWDKEAFEEFEQALWDTIHPKVRQAVYDAIREYVSYNRTAAAERAARDKNLDGGSEPIPF